MPLPPLGEENVSARHKAEDSANAEISYCHGTYSGIFAKQPRGAAEKDGNRDRLREKWFLLMGSKVECFTENNVIQHRSQEQERKSPGRKHARGQPWKMVSDDKEHDEECAGATHKQCGRLP